MTPERRNAYPVTAETIADLVTKLEKTDRERDALRARSAKADELLRACSQKVYELGLYGPNWNDLVIEIEEHLNG